MSHLVTPLPSACSSTRIIRFVSTDKQKDGKESIFIPRAIPNPEGYKETPVRLPRTFTGWRRAFSLAFADYKSTFDNFGRQQQREEDEIEEKIEETTEKIYKTRQEVQQNVKRNVQFIQEESTKALETAQEKTGIYTTDDLKRWVGEQLKLANECLGEFMAGYRKGRDDEVDRVLNEYFVEAEESDKKESTTAAPRKRRKPIRRIKRIQT